MTPQVPTDHPVVELLDTIATHYDRIREREADLVSDLGIDSADRLRLALHIRAELGISITDDVRDGWKSVGDVVDFYDRHKPSGGH